MPNMLSAEWIGEAGEAEFKRLCTQAQIVCNKSTQDVNGWDYIIEFPSEGDDCLPIDRRQAWTSYVQVKATAAVANDKISVKLSALERLAKRSNPSFLVVIQMNSSGECTTGYLIHILDDVLAKILRRLREAQFNSKDPNTIKLSFAYKKVGTRFDLNAQEIKASIFSRIGSNASSYTYAKQRQLDELGYETGGIEAAVKFQLDGPEHLSNIALGLAPIKAIEVQGYDTRFNISLPCELPFLSQLEEFTITPHTFAECNLTFRGASLSTAPNYTVQLQTSPIFNRMKDFSAFLVQHRDFSIKFDKNEVRFNLTSSLEEMTRNLEDWSKITRSLANLTTSDGHLVLSGFKDCSPLTLPVGQTLNGPYVDQLPNMASFFENWKNALSVAGVSSSVEFSLEDLFTAADAQLTVSLLFNCFDQTAYFEYKNDVTFSNKASVEAIYANRARLADVEICYCVKVLLERNDNSEWNYKSIKTDAIDISPYVTDLKAYAEQHAETLGINCILDASRVIDATPSPEPEP